MQSLRATHANGTATATPTKISVKRGRGFRLLIRNLEAVGGNDLEVSFDGGANFYAIGPQTELKEDVAFHYFFVKGSGDYTALILEG